MPRIIKYTDQICVEKNRTILFVDFDYNAFKDNGNLREETPFIKETLEWLKTNNIDYELIGPFSNSGFLCGYYGRYYIDVPYENDNNQYKLLELYFENIDGTMKDPRKLFCYTTLDVCEPILAESEAMWVDPDYEP